MGRRMDKMGLVSLLHLCKQCQLRLTVLLSESQCLFLEIRLITVPTSRHLGVQSRCQMLKRMPINMDPKGHRFLELGSLGASQARLGLPDPYLMG